MKIRALAGRLCALVLFTAVATSPFASPACAASTLTVAPLTWNVIGLDGNSPTSGPNRFPIGARVCSSVATTNVAVDFVWDSANANVNLRPGSLSTITIPSLFAGGCSDAYFEVEVTKVPAAYDTARRYHIRATDFSGTASTPTPRELYVEHLISQGRNSVTGVKLEGVSIPAGGSMSLMVGNTYTIELDGGTATQGYEQFEAFINFPNTIFQILSVSTSYSADSSPYVPNPNDRLYADACLWANDPNSPNYRSCIGADGKAGGSNVVTTYTITVIGGAGTSQALNTLFYDFSGSSFHYNADFTTGARIANIVDPTAASIAKTFTPATTNVNGVSKLTITLTNPTSAPIGGYNFVDNLPVGLTVANPPAAAMASCGTPSFSPAAGATSLSFANGTVAANGSCAISVNVTAAAAATYVNTTDHLFVDTLDTGHSATASLTVNDAPAPPPCTPGLELARFTMDAAQGTGVPPAPSFQASNVATATASYSGGGASAIDTATGNPVNAWSVTGGWAANSTGYPNPAAPYFEFTVDTSRFSAPVAISFDLFLDGNWANASNNFLYVYSSADGGAFTNVLTFNPISKTTWYTQTATASAVGASTTTFRINVVGQQQPTAVIFLDNISITGCGVPVPPTLAKAFSPSPVAVNGTSVLTFTLTNPDNVILSGVTFTDALPTGTQVAPTPAASTTCGGAPTWAPAPGATSLTFGSPTGGTIPARVGTTNGTCTAEVTVVATSAGPHDNVSGYVSSTQTGVNTGAGGSGSASITALLPPSISKLFTPSPILPGGVSTLTFVITNPNQNDTLSGVAFGDTFPTSPGAMVVAATPNPTTVGCGAPAFSPAAGAGSISFSGGTIAGGGTCTVSVDVTAPAAGAYANTSGNVSFVINATTVNGNTASGSLGVNPPHPSIAILKQVGASAAGPWLDYLALPAGGSVYYRFTVENTGDVPLSPIGVTDGTIDVSSCTWPATLPVAVAANNDHIATCVVGPVLAVAGTNPNTAHATGTYSGAPYDSADSTATYATTGLTIVKSAAEPYFAAAGDILHYSYLVTNSGAATLDGPVTVADDRTTVTCPALATVGNLDDFFQPGESMTCTATYVVTVFDVGSQSVTNHASASAGGASSSQTSKTVPLQGTPVGLSRFTAD